MQRSFNRVPVLPPLAVLICLGTAGCATHPVNWTMIEPSSPSNQSTAVGINSEGATWFFQCDGRDMMSGFRARSVEKAEGQESVLSIKLDAEPAEQSSWRAEKNTYVLRGDAATALARRAALAYNAVVTVDGATLKFPLTGSHDAMIRMTRNCAFLAVQ